MSLGSETGVKSRTGVALGRGSAASAPASSPPPGLNSRGALVQDVAAQDPFPPGSRMTAVDLSANGGFAQLARAFVDIQAQEFLPLLPAAGVRDLRGALADTGALLLAGVPEEVLLRLVAWRPAPAGPGRDVLPRPAVSQLAQSPGGPGGAPAEQAAGAAGSR